jgi:hypothetical protein
MTDRRYSDVHVEQLTVRVPASAALGDAGALGAPLADALALRLAGLGGDRRLGAVHARVELPAGASRAELITAIADAVARAVEDTHA